jgi:hypothetical protein
MSKTSFRPRQVDYTKQMPVYVNDELPDLQDYSTINRSVPQMPSGMEKEEESVNYPFTFITLKTAMKPIVALISTYFQMI